MEKKKSTAKKVLNSVLTVILVIYMIVALLISVMIFTSMKSGYPSVFGYTVMHVLTDSMEGDKEDSLFVGDMALCKKQDDYTDLDIGEIIAYRVAVYDDNNNPVEIVKIHRIISRAEDGVSYITQGDNTPAADDVPVFPGQILGVYNGTRIPVLGSVINFVKSQTGILVCLVIPMALFFMYALYKFVKALLEYKMSKAPAGGLTEEQKQKAIEEYLAKQAQEQADSAAENKVENNSAEDDSAE